MTLTTDNRAFELTRGFSDFLVVFGNPRAYGAEGDPLLQEWLYPVAPPDLAAQVGGAHDRLAHRLIDVSTHRAGWAHLFDGLGVLPTSAQNVFADNTIMALAMAREGGAVALARVPASDKAVEEAGLVPCLPDAEGPGLEGYHLVYPDCGALRPPARAFRSWLLHCCGSIA